MSKGKSRVRILGAEGTRDEAAEPAYPTAPPEPEPAPEPTVDAPGPAESPEPGPERAGAPDAHASPAPGLVKPADAPSPAAVKDTAVRVRQMPDPPSASRTPYPTAPTRAKPKRAAARLPSMDAAKKRLPRFNLDFFRGKKKDAGLAELERVLVLAVSRHERIRPGFSGAWVSPEIPPEAVVVHEHEIPGCRIRVCRLPAADEGLYHIEPEEYALREDELRILLAARDVLANEYPESLDLTNLRQAREYVIRRGEAILSDLHDRGLNRLDGTPAQVRANLDRLARILARYTAGYGVLEVLLEDPMVSDIYVNAPALKTPLRVTLHAPEDVPQKCRTNVNLTRSDEDSFLSRLRYESGRPFSEAYPVMDADLSLFGARAAVIGPPLSPGGLAVALRRHAPEPWTLLRLMDKGAVDPLTASLLSTLIQGQSTLIIAGGRGSGKTSLLSALLFEIPRGNRILTVEDTPEIPVGALQGSGYQVQAITVRSSVGGGTEAELSASDALKIAMRLGESAIVMGEVRGDEARTLYESMRAGTAGSTVLGTFHGDSAQSVFQRAVYDMGISAQSFAATDAVVIAGLVKRGGTAQFARRLVQIAEFDKAHPESGVFHDLLHYDVGEQDWVLTDRLQRSSSLFSSIGAKWGLSYFDTMHMVETRASVYAHVLSRSRELKRPELLGASGMPIVNGIMQERFQAQPLKGADHERIVREAIEQLEAQLIQA